MTSTFVFDDVKDAADIMNFEKEGFIYTRGNNPTLLFEQRMSELEEGEDAVAFASGMGAISSVLLSLLSPGDNAVVHKTRWVQLYRDAQTSSKIQYKLQSVNLRNRKPWKGHR